MTARYQDGPEVSAFLRFKMGYTGVKPLEVKH